VAHAASVEEQQAPRRGPPQQPRRGIQRVQLLRQRAAQAKPPPCKKTKSQPPLAIEVRYPVLVKDYHPVDDAINPNAIPDKVADSTARVIMREHLAWERENPEPPKQFSMQELKDMGEKIDENTLAIQREKKQFDTLAKFVHDDDAAYNAAQKAKLDAAKAKILALKREAEKKRREAAALRKAQLHELHKQQIKKQKKIAAKEAARLKKLQESAKKAAAAARAAAERKKALAKKLAAAKAAALAKARKAAAAAALARRKAALAKARKGKGGKRRRRGGKRRRRGGKRRRRGGKRRRNRKGGKRRKVAKKA